MLLLSLLINIALWQSLKQSSAAQAQRTLLNETHLIRTDVEQYVKTHIQALQRMAQRWEMDGGTPQNKWQADARNFVAGHNGLRTIEWVDKSYHVRWIEPLAGNEKALGLNIIFNEQRKQILTGASSRKSITLTPPLDLVQGYKAFIVYTPVYVDNAIDGFIVGIFDIQQLLDNFLAAGREPVTVRRFGMSLSFNSFFFDKSFQPRNHLDGICIRGQLRQSFVHGRRTKDSPNKTRA